MDDWRAEVDELVEQRGGVAGAARWLRTLGHEVGDDDETLIRYLLGQVVAIRRMGLPHDDRLPQNLASICSLLLDEAQRQPSGSYVVPGAVIRQLAAALNRD
jgi:hypothetical protein